MLKTADFERHKVCATPLYPAYHTLVQDAIRWTGGRLDAEKK